jgi:two-component system cell cycle response regulator
MQLDVFSELPCAILVTDTDDRVIFANPNFVTLILSAPDQAMPEFMDSLLTRASSIFCQTHVLPMLRRDGEVHEIFLYLHRPTGTPLPVMTNIKRTNLQGQTAYIWLFFVALERSRFESELLEARQQAEILASQLIDAHESLRALNAQLEARAVVTADANRSLTQLTFTDSLTGMGNRRTLSAAAAIIEEQQDAAFSVLMIDIDHFKSVNDTHGHDRGDAVLRELGQCLQSAARQGDSVIRYGGEEFALILPNADAEQSLHVAQRVHQSVVAARPGGLDLKVSIGAATTEAGQSQDLLATLKLAGTSWTSGSCTG